MWIFHFEYAVLLCKFVCYIHIHFNVTSVKLGSLNPSMSPCNVRKLVIYDLYNFYRFFDYLILHPLYQLPHLLLYNKNNKKNILL
jgi:hypothetical protein